MIVRGDTFLLDPFLQLLNAAIGSFKRWADLFNSRIRSATLLVMPLVITSSSAGLPIPFPAALASVLLAPLKIPLPIADSLLSPKSDVHGVAKQPVISRQQSAFSVQPSALSKSAISIHPSYLSILHSAFRTPHSSLAPSPLRPVSPCSYLNKSE